MRPFLVKSFMLAGMTVLIHHNAMAAADVNPPNPASASPAAASGSGTQPEDPQSELSNLESMTMQTLPAEVAMVKGNYHKYQAISWKNRGYSGGVKDFSARYKTKNDVEVEMGGRAIMGNNDYQGDLLITKKDEGYLKFDYKQFRKYYDIYGGMYDLFPVLGSNTLSRDLSLDIGHIGVEAGITRPDLPMVSLFYEHDYKNGSKSMLNWGTVRMGTAGLRHQIAPSWKEIDETTDTFGIRAEHTLNDYHLTGDHRWELSRWKTRGYEIRLSDVAGTNTNQRRQDHVQETDVMMTTLGADKWFLQDKVFASSAYRFEHLKNQDRQNLEEFTQNGTPTPAGTLFKPEGNAHNHLNLSSWVLNLMGNPWTWLSGSGRFKAEVAGRDAESYYPNDTAGTIGVIDNNAKTNTDSSTYKFAESFGLRFKAIPRTSVYSDLAFEQSQNHLIVNRLGIAGESAAVASDTHTRDALIVEPVTTWTTGVNVQPVRRVNLASQFRLRDKNMNFDDRFRIRPVQGQVFLEKLDTRSLTLTQRATIQLASWAQTSFRYLYDETDYTTRAVYENVDEKADMLSHTFIYDVSVFPLSNLSMTGSYTRQNMGTKTVAASSGVLIPTFTSDSSTWMFHTDYQPHKKVNLNSTLFYTAASNYNDFQNTSFVYYGADFDQIGATAGCKWNLRKDVTILPQYAFSLYRPKEYSAGSGYEAHVISIALSTSWG